MLQFGRALFRGESPVILSGFGTNPTIPVSNGTAAFQLRIGTGGMDTYGVLKLPFSEYGWVLGHVSNLITFNKNRVVKCGEGSTQSLITLTNYTPEGVEIPFIPGDVYELSLIGM